VQQLGGNTASSTAKLEPTDGERWYGGYGKGVDYARAVQCFQQAMDAGLATAAANLSWCYFNGRGVAKDETEAARLGRRAVEEMGLVEASSGPRSVAREEAGDNRFTSAAVRYVHDIDCIDREYPYRSDTLWDLKGGGGGEQQILTASAVQGT
jgi:hypothetical protein